MFLLQMDLKDCNQCFKGRRFVRTMPKNSQTRKMPPKFWGEFILLESLSFVEEKQDIFELDSQITKQISRCARNPESEKN